MTQWRWKARPAIDQSVGDMLRNALAVAGARVVAPAEAQLHLALEILEADVTDDGELAGEETFGRVKVRLTATDSAGAMICEQREEVTFSDPDQQDPGLLGAALYEVVVKTLSTLELPAPTS